MCKALGSIPRIIVNKIAKGHRITLDPEVRGHFTLGNKNQAWWLIPIILVLGRRK